MLPALKTQHHFGACLSGGQKRRDCFVFGLLAQLAVKGWAVVAHFTHIAHHE
jgi:hypothetical protein